GSVQCDCIARSHAKDAITNAIYLAVYIYGVIALTKHSVAVCYNGGVAFYCDSAAGASIFDFICLYRTACILIGVYAAFMHISATLDCKTCIRSDIKSVILFAGQGMPAQIKNEGFVNIDACANAI